MTERPDPDRAPEPVPGVADPERGDALATEPVPAPFEDPGVEHPPVEEPTQVQAAGTAGAIADSAWDRRVSGARAPAPVAPTPEPFAPPAGPPASSPGSSNGAPAVEERPELPVLGAFAAGLVLALILKRLGN